MEGLQERLQLADKALNTFHEIVKIKQPSAIERDAAIQRFGFSFEICWKTGKQFLYDVEGLEIGSPKGIMRSFREIDVFYEDETILGLQMVNDKNLTVHTYNEDLADEIFGELPQYYHLLRNWMDRLEDKNSSL